MKKDGKYRFSLQFSADTDAKIRAGEILERLGNKKSAVVVAALDSYVRDHPELCTPALTIRIDQDTALRREKLEEMIRSIVEEHMLRNGLQKEAATTGEAVADTLDEDITQMLNNLEMFN